MEEQSSSTKSKNLFIILNYSDFIDDLTYRSSVVEDFEVWFESDIGLHWFGLSEIRRLAHVVLVQLGKEGFVGCLREHTFLLQDRKDSHGLEETILCCRAETGYFIAQQLAPQQPVDVTYSDPLYPSAVLSCYSFVILRSW